MFTNDKRQAERTGKYGTPRQTHLQNLVTQFQNPTTSLETKQKLVANLANFSYDPYNYTHLRSLNILELFIDCLTEPSEHLIEFAAGGLCNAAVDPDNARVIVDCGGVAALVECLKSPVRNTVKYAIGGLYYLCEVSGVKDELGKDVVELVSKFADGGEVCVGFRNLARAFLDKHFG